MNKQVQTYQQMHVSGLNQKDLIVMLYSGALKFIDEGKKIIHTNDIQAIHEKLSRARNIFIHLLVTLNMEKGGEFALKLSSLYAYFIEKITVANVTKNEKELDDIIPLINDIKDAWEQIDLENVNVKKSNSNPAVKNKQVLSLEV